MKSVLDVMVSCFRSYHTPENPLPVNLLTWLHSAKYQAQTAQIRRLTDKAERDKRKALLPCITPSGLFSHRSEKGLITHSGLICLDIDYKDNQQVGNFTELKTCLSRIENVAYCGLSVSGQGYFLLIPLADPLRHKAHFRALQQDFKRLCIQPDPACKDISRLRGYSYDAEGYFNHAAIPYYKTLEEANPDPTSLPSTKASPPEPAFSAPHPLLGSKVEQLVILIAENKIDITSAYRNWFEIGCSFANAFGEAGRTYFQTISQFHEGYLASETNKQFDACLKYRYRYTIATFFKYCKDFGITLPAEPQKPYDLTPFRKPQALEQLTVKYPFLSGFIKELDLVISPDYTTLYP